jgi:hypothetical protein
MGGEVGHGEWEAEKRREKAPQVRTLLSSTRTFFFSQSASAGPLKDFLLTERLHSFLVFSAFGGSWRQRSKREAIRRRAMVVLRSRSFQLTKELSSHEDPDELHLGTDHCFAALTFLQTTSATTPAIAPAISPSSKKASDITCGHQI